MPVIVFFNPAPRVMRIPLLLIVLAGLLPGCGYKGPLYLPDAKKPAQERPAPDAPRPSEKKPGA